MDFALAAVVFAPALALGSFLNVVAARVPLRGSIVRPPSACMACEQEIAWYDNVPLLSYGVLRGRCRNCAVRIPLVYPAVELVTALLIAGCVLAFGLTMEAAVAAFFCAVLVAVSDHPEPDRPACDGPRPRRQHGPRLKPGVGARSARRFRLPLRSRARVSGGDGHG